MGLHSYHYSRKLANLDPPFESLIFAAIRKADSVNMERLEASFPELVAEMKLRYNARLGVIPEDGELDLDALAEQINAMLYPERKYDAANA